LIPDLPSFEAHVVRTASAGVGPLIAGSMGEAIHLSHSERVKLIHAAEGSGQPPGLITSQLLPGQAQGVPGKRLNSQMKRQQPAPTMLSSLPVVILQVFWQTTVRP